MPIEMVAFQVNLSLFLLIAKTIGSTQQIKQWTQREKKNTYSIGWPAVVCLLCDFFLFTFLLFIIHLRNCFSNAVNQTSNERSFFVCKFLIFYCDLLISPCTTVWFHMVSYFIHRISCTQRTNSAHTSTNTRTKATQQYKLIYSVQRRVKQQLHLRFYRMIMK